jgi:hypothetical protein
MSYNLQIIGLKKDDKKPATYIENELSKYKAKEFSIPIGKIDAVNTHLVQLVQSYNFKHSLKERGSNTLVLVGQEREISRALQALLDFVSPKSSLAKKVSISMQGLTMLVKAFKNSFESVRDDFKILMTFGIEQITLQGPCDKVDEAYK